MFVIRYTQDGVYNEGRGNPVQFGEATRYATLAAAEALREDVDEYEIIDESAISGETGVAVIVDGRIAAWFAEFDSGAEEFCTENFFGRWVTMPAYYPRIISPTTEELMRVQELALQLMKKMTPETALDLFERMSDATPD